MQKLKTSHTPESDGAYSVFELLQWLILSFTYESVGVWAEHENSLDIIKDDGKLLVYISIHNYN